MRAATPAVLAALAATAVADPGSARYPPEPHDADKEAEEYSDFWEKVLVPDRGDYDQLLTQARRLIDGKTPQNLADAIDLLGTAIDRVNTAPDAYFLRGWAEELALNWPACATDYVAAATLDPDYEPTPNPRDRGPLADGAGVCLSRAGRFEDAEAMLAQATATGTATTNEWLHLAEADMGLGRLDDAITALDGALKVARGAETASVYWLRAVAFDRSRQPSDAVEAAEAALKADLNMTWALSRRLPAAPPEDFFYIAGLAYETGIDTRPALPERAVLYFREFVKQSGRDSPWKKRAVEHVDALGTFDPATALTRTNAKQGTSTLDAAAIGKAVGKNLRAMSSCMTDVPQSIAEVRVVLHGAPVKPKRGAPVVLVPRPPAAGVTARLVGQVAQVPPPTTADTQKATKCLETAAGKLRLAKLEKGTWVQLTFPVISR